MAGVDASAASAAVIATVYVPAGRSSGPAIEPGVKSSSVRLPLTHTSTVSPGTPWKTESLASEAADAGIAARVRKARAPAAMPASRRVRMVRPSRTGPVEVQDGRPMC